MRLVSASSDEALIACSLSAWTGEKGRCVWCDGPLSGRQTRWCSPACSDAFAVNHWWSSASRAAKKRDGHACVRCGAEGVDYGVGARGLQAHHKIPLHTISIEISGWDRVRQTFITVERRVRHSDSGCWHHLDGLETLCDEHHLDEHRSDAEPVDDDQLVLAVE